MPILIFYYFYFLLSLFVRSFVYFSQSTPHLANSLLTHVGMYVYSITYLLIPITPPAHILNLPINSFCPLDTDLVFTSDNFHSILPSSPPHLSSSCFFIWLLLLETATWRHLYCLFKFILIWLRNTSVSVETYQLIFRVFICAFHPWISSFFR